MALCRDARRLNIGIDVSGLHVVGVPFAPEKSYRSLLTLKANVLTVAAKVALRGLM